MSSIKKKILVLSGKGGVGKSTVSCQLAWSLAECGLQVGLLDIDICGPSVPHLMGVASSSIKQSPLGWIPVYPVENIAVVSVGFLLDDPNAAIIWRGPKKNGLIKQFLKDVDWGEDVDVLIVDCPPGTTDEHLSISTYLSSIIDGAVVVTTPQDVAVSDVMKELTFCEKVNIPVLGVVTNMAGFTCPCCSEFIEILPSNGSVQRMCAEFKVPMLPSIPMDPALVQAGEQGQHLRSSVGVAPAGAASALRQLATSVMAALKLEPRDN